MHDPVVTDDGNTYERQALEESMRSNGLSPITRQPIRHIIPNRTLLNNIHG